MLESLMNNWEYVLLVLYVVEKAIKLSPSKKDDLVWDMVLKPIVDKIKGKYEVIGSIEKLKGVKKVVMTEFFNYSCGHCYRFLETSKKLRAKFKDKLYHKKYPIYWGQQTAFPAKAFYIADELGLEEKFTQELFDTNFKLHVNIFQPRVIQRL